MTVDWLSASSKMCASEAVYNILACFYGHHLFCRIENINNAVSEEIFGSFVRCVAAFFWTFQIFWIIFHSIPTSPILLFSIFDLGAFDWSFAGCLHSLAVVVVHSIAVTGTIANNFVLQFLLRMFCDKLKSTLTTFLAGRVGAASRPVGWS